MGALDFSKYAKPVDDKDEPDFSAHSVEAKAKSPSVLDVARSALVGLVGDTARAGGWGLEKAGVDYGTRMRQAGDWFENEQKTAMTPGGRRAFEDPIVTGDGFRDLALTDKWGQGALMGGARSLPQMAVTAPVGAVGATAIGALGRVVAPATMKAAEAGAPGVAAWLGRTAPSALAYSGTEGVQAGALNAAQSTSDTEALPIEKIRKAPVFEQFLSETDPSLPMGERERIVQGRITKEIGDKVFRETALSTGAIGLMTGGGALGVADRIVRRNAAGALGAARDGAVKTVLKGIGSEAIQEGPQSSGEAYIQNKADQTYLDASKDPMKGVLAQGAAGAIVGGLTGGLVGGAGAIARPRAAEGEQPDEGNSFLERVRSALGVGGAAQPAPPAAPGKTRDYGNVSPTRNDVTADTQAQEKALRTPEGVTPLEHVQALDEKIAALRAQAPDPRVDMQVDDLLSERNELAKDFPKFVFGAPTEIRTPTGTKLSARWALADLGDIVTSHDPRTGRERSNYPQSMQPRDRSAAAYRLQQTSIAQKLDPDLLWDSLTIADGAPTVGLDGLIESGAGRTNAIELAYDIEGEPIQRYRQKLATHLASIGIDPAVAESLPRPILLRVRETPVNRAEFARQANAPTTAQMNPMDTAKSDAKRMGSLEGLQTNEDGDVFTQANRDVVKGFFSFLTLNEQTALVDLKGNISSAGQQRFLNALVVKAYGEDSPAVMRMVGSMNDDLRNLSKALVRVAPRVAQAREAFAAGALPDRDITGALIGAVDELVKLREAGTSVADALAQAGMFEAMPEESAVLIAFLDANIRAPRRIAQFIENYLDEVGKYAAAGAREMFGGNEAPSRLNLLQTAKESVNDTPSPDNAVQPGAPEAGATARPGATGAVDSGAAEVPGPVAVDGGNAGQPERGNGGEKGAQDGPVEDAAKVAKDAKDGEAAKTSEKAAIPPVFPEGAQENEQKPQKASELKRDVTLGNATKRSVAWKQAFKDGAVALADEAEAAGHTKLTQQVRNARAKIPGDWDEAKATGYIEAKRGELARWVKAQEKRAGASINAQLKARGVQIESTLDAERRHSNGERIFIQHDMEETPTEVRGVSELRAYSADQMMALPAAPSLSKPATPAGRIAEIDRELAALQAQYEKKSEAGNKGRGAMVPPAIKKSALESITNKMGKLDAEKAALLAPKETPKKATPMEKAPAGGWTDADKVPKAQQPAVQPVEQSAEDKAKDDLKAALADLGDIFGKNTRLNITPEVEQKLLPVMTRLFDAAFRLGHIKFKAAARYVRDQIREALGMEVADQLTHEHFQGGYIALSGRYKAQGAETAKEVAAVESLDEQEASDEPKQLPAASEVSAPEKEPAASTEKAVAVRGQSTLLKNIGVPAKAKPDTLYVYGGDWSTGSREEVLVDLPHGGDPLSIFSQFKEQNSAATPSVIVATDAEGKPWKIISPNGNMADFDSADGRYIAGDTDAYRNDSMARIEAAREQGDPDKINAAADERISELKKEIEKRKASIERNLKELAEHKAMQKSGVNIKDHDSRFDSWKEYFANSKRITEAIRHYLSEQEAELAGWEAQKVKTVEAEKEVESTPDDPVVLRLPSVEGTEIHVVKNTTGYAVSMKDTDIGEYLPTLRLFKGDDALAKATEYAEGIQKKAEPPVAESVSPVSSVSGGPRAQSVTTTEWAGHPPFGAPRAESSYLNQAEYERSLRNTYFGEGRKLESRTTPQSVAVPAVGSWMMDPVGIQYGREIYELRELPVNSLEISEDTGPEKRADVKRYAEWLLDGKEAQPVYVIQHESGSLKTQDHRRLMAAKLAGRDTIKAWVNWSTRAGLDGKTDGEKAVVGMTYELAAAGKIPIAQKAARPDFTMFTDDRRMFAQLRKELVEEGIQKKAEPAKQAAEMFSHPTLGELTAKEVRGLSRAGNPDNMAWAKRTMADWLKENKAAPSNPTAKEKVLAELAEVETLRGLGNWRQAARNAGLGAERDVARAATAREQQIRQGLLNDKKAEPEEQLEAYKDRAKARKAADRLERAGGGKHKVIPHPSVRKRFAAVPVGEPTEKQRQARESAGKRLKALAAAQRRISEDDNLLAVIAKLGGMNLDAIVKEWGVDPADVKGLRGAGILLVAKQNGGMTPDAMGEALAEIGRLPTDQHGKWDLADLEAAFDKALRAAGGAQTAEDVYGPDDYAAVDALPEEDQLDVAETVAGTSAPEQWSTMTEDEKDAELDTLFGPENPVAKSEGSGTQAPAREVGRGGEQDSAQAEEVAKYQFASDNKEASTRFGSMIQPITDEMRPLLDAVGKALDEGVFYNTDFNKRVGEILGVPIPENGPASYETYLARKRVEGDRESSNLRDLAGKIKVGAVLRDLSVLAGGKRRTFSTATVTSVSEDGRKVELSVSGRGYKGEPKLTLSAGSPDLQAALEKAEVAPPGAEPTRSEKLITKWQGILKDSPKTARDRLSAFLASVSLGANFAENRDAYHAREGFTEFVNWALATIKALDAGRPALELATQTEADLKAKQAALDAAAKAKADEEAAAEAKRKADAERGDFTLSGSDRTADANPAQAGMFDQPASPGNAIADALRTAADSIEKALKPAGNPPAESEGMPAIGVESSGEAENVPSTVSDLERDSAEPAAQAQGDGISVPDGARGTGAGARPGGQRHRGAGRRPSDDPGLPFDGPSAIGERSDQPVYPTEQSAFPSELAPGVGDDERGDTVGDLGVRPEAIPDKEVADVARQGAADLIAKRAAQRRAQEAPQKPGIANVRESLPFLLPGQQDDVNFAEERFVVGPGVMFTNGTGTGKTYSGLGVVKRFERRGIKDTIIIVPSDKIAADWVDAGKNLVLNIHQLNGTTDNGGDKIVVTTYANFYQNNALAKRKWDLAIADESHMLMQNKAGERTQILAAFQALTRHKDGGSRFQRMMLPKQYADLDAAKAKAKELHDRSKREAGLKSDVFAADEEVKRIYRDIEAKAKPILDEYAKDAKTKVVMMSATPFAYDKTVDYAEGYLFEYPPNSNGGYNSLGGQNAFMAQHFGMSMRYNKLNQADASVDRGLMQRQFNTWLKRERVLSSRILDIDQDYDRKFVLVDSPIGRQIDEALEYLRDFQRKKGLSPAQKKGEEDLSHLIGETFDYLTRRFVLESIKATEVIPLAKEHIALGRKVVIYHDYKKGWSGSNPFRVNTDLGAIAAANAAFQARFPELMAYPFHKLGTSLDTLKRAFPDAVIYNGDVPAKKRREAIAQFNKDNSDASVMVIQSASSAGISAHDTTGKHGRVLFNLGLPTQPTTAIQQEGRIYRVGQKSHAMFRYMNTGTSWERQAFAMTIAQRASAAENLALGEQARSLLDAFVNGFENSDNYKAGEEGEGTGGKEADRAALTAISEYDRAKSFYFGTQKKTARNKAVEGKDYFATPEPIGLKMVEFLRLQQGDEVLEPSAGHGAIARWIPENLGRTAIEPSAELASRLAMGFGGKIVNDSFENHHIVNKYDGIVMNPPFGSGGKTAFDHVQKALDHLREGGRVVALVPSGPSADKRMEKMLYGEDEKGKPANPGVYLIGDIKLPTVTFERAGTSVSAHIIVLQKGGDGQQINRDFSDAESINDLFDRIESVDFPLRPKIESPVASVTSRAEALLSGRDGRLPNATAPADTVTGAADTDAPAAPARASAGGFSLSESKHIHTGATVYTASLSDRVSREAYRELNDLAKKEGGYYSKYRNNATGAKAGFVFKTDAERSSFVRAAADTPDTPLNNIEPMTVPQVRVPDTLRKSLGKLDAGKITNEEFAQSVRDLLGALTMRKEIREFKDETKDRVRGAEWFKERLIRAGRLGELTAEQTDFALWLLERSPQVAEDLGISIREKINGGSAGQYNPYSRVAIYATSSKNTETTVHEILHHTERMMPPEVQRGIAKEYERQMLRAWNKGTKAERQILQDMVLAQAGDTKAYRRVTLAITYGKVEYGFYQFTNLSEFWAVNASRIMGARYEAQSWVAKARQWLRELVQKIKALFGAKSDAAVLKGLQAVLDGTGERLSKDMLTGLVQAKFENVEPDSDAAGRQELADRIDAILRGEMSGQPLYLGQTPAVLRRLGMKPLPMGIIESNAEKSVFDHGVLSREMKALADLLADPVAVFDSATVPGAVVVATDLVKSDGRPVIVAVHPNMEIRRVAANEVKSAYPRNDHEATMKRWFQDRLRYVNNGKRPEWQRFTGLQLPEKMPTRSAEKIVLTERDIVKADRAAAWGADPFRKPQASRGAGASETGTPVDEIIAILKGKFGAGIDRALSSGLLNIARTPEGLPPNLRSRTTIEEGWYDVKARDGKGAVWIVASNIAKDRVVPVFFHEMGEHHGLPLMLGQAGYDRLVADVRSVHAAGKATAVEAAWALVKRQHPRLDEKSEDFVAEVLAKVGESAAGRSLPFYRRLIAAVRAFLRTLGLTGTVTDDDIRTLVEASAKRQIAKAGDARGYPVRSAPAASSANEPLASRNDQNEMFTGSEGVDLRTPKGQKRAEFEAKKIVGDILQSSKKFNWWHKTVGTQYHKATVDSHFGRVFKLGQEFLVDVSRFAIQAEAKAQDLLHRIERVSDVNPVKITQQIRQDKVDHPVIARALFDGTLAGGENPENGRVWNNGELRRKFGLNDRQIALYRQGRDAVDLSLEQLGASIMARIAKTHEIMVNADESMDDIQARITDALTTMLEDVNFRIQASADVGGNMGLDRQKGEAMQTALDKVAEVSKRVKALQAGGYMPLMRFGSYAVDVVEKVEGGTERRYFSMYETETQANQAARALREEFPKATASVSPVSKEAFKLFKGMSPDTIAIFADIAGLDEHPLMQEYIAQAVSDRSALKRLIQRKAVPGYSDDVVRVLAQFIASNARAASGNYHHASLMEAVNEIPKDKGDVKDEAFRLYHYLTDPTEEAAALRGYLFFHFLGGSMASALVNMTQPVLMTAPYLTQFASVAKVTSELGRAMKDGAKSDYFPADKAGQAMKVAVEEGIVAPHEIYQLMATARGGAGRSKLLHGVTRVWGGFFSLAEAWNRRSTFLAAHRIGETMTPNELAKAGVDTVYDFAVKAVEETQGIYNRGNRPNWARGTIGATVFTFKQFSVSYLEWLKRLPPQQRAIAAAVLFLAAGMNGLPGGDDLDDILDTLGQWMGHGTNMKRWKRETVEGLFGEEVGQFVLNGMSAIPGMPLDVQARLGLGNLFPGTGLLKPSETNKMRDIVEFVGPVGGLAKSAGDALEAAAKGNVGAAARAVLPVALRNAVQGIEMFATGQYKDTKGRLVTDADAVDAMVKTIGFQPAKIAAQSRRLTEIFEDVNLHKVIEAGIAARWAHAIADGDSDAMNSARQELLDWNESNPDMMIRIGRSQILSRVKAIKATRDQRTLKTTPKELRARVMVDIAE